MLFDVALHPASSLMMVLLMPLENVGTGKSPIIQVPSHSTGPTVSTLQFKFILAFDLLLLLILQLGPHGWRPQKTHHWT
jgi:hypothetical protein